MQKTKAGASVGLADCEFRIGPWLVQPRLSRVCRDGVPVHVTPRAMAVLVYLAEANGAVVSRNQILDAVWARMQVTPDALVQCLVELRRVFGDDAKHPTTIQTITKIGVRLIAPVIVEENTASGLPADVAGGERRKHAAGPQWFWPTAAAGLVLATALAVVSFRMAEGPEARQRDAASARERLSLAVLPFSYDTAADDDLRFFADAIHDELLSRLAKVEALERVTSRSAVMRYRGSSKTIEQIGAELNVGTVLEGRVFEMGGAVRLNVQLVDTATNTILWADTYTRALTADAFLAVQSELTVAIADALDLTLSPDELSRLDAVPTRSTRANEFYLSGNDYWRRVNEPHKSLPLMVQQYTKAVEADPEFALAWARLGIAHLGLYWYAIDRTAARLSLADAAIRRALELAPALPEAHLARADFLFRARSDYDAALAELAIAQKGLPQSADIRFVRGSLNLRRGEWDRSIADHEEALALDPRNVVYLRQQSLAYMFKRDYASVERNLDRILELAPDDGTAHVDRVHLGLYSDGDTSLARRYEQSSPSASYTTALASTYVRWLAAIFDRDYAKALGVLDESKEDPVFDGDLRNSSSPKALLYGRTHALAGNRQEAVRQWQLAKTAIEEQIRGTEPTPQMRVTLAEVHAALGDAQAAADLLAGMPPISSPMEDSGVRLAIAIRVLLPLGELDRALEELDRYLGTAGRWSIEGLSADPRMAPLRTDSRFVTLSRRHARDQ